MHYNNELLQDTTHFRNINNTICSVNDWYIKVWIHKGSTQRLLMELKSSPYCSWDCNCIGFVEAARWDFMKKVPVKIGMLL